MIWPSAKLAQTERSEGRSRGKLRTDRCRLQAQRFPQRPASPGADRRHGTRRQRQLAAAGPHHFPDSALQQQRATFLLERASTAAYIAYQRAGNAGEEADALAVLGRAMSERKLWRPALDAFRLSLDLREVADVRGQYEKMRDQYGFRLLDYTVDSDAASPRACFQFSEDLAKRTDFAPFLALAGNDKPALSSEGKQLCVDGLSTASATTSTCAPGCRPPSRKACRNRLNSISMCATASRSCASPGGPMCCRAPASAAFRWSASIPGGVGQCVSDRRP